jgi:hypothetical protein
MASDRAMRIMADPERVINSVDGWPGDGFSNPDADALIACASDLSAIPDDEERDAVVHPWVELCSLIGKAFQLLVRAQDQRFALLNSDMAKMWAVQAGKVAETSTPTFGHGSPQDREDLIASKRDASRREQETNVGNKVGDDFQKKADDLAAKASAAADEANDAIRGAIARVERPLSLQADVELVDLAKQERCRQEILSWNPQEAMKKALVQVQRAIQQDDKPILKNLLPAAIAAANEFLKTPPAKLNAIAGYYGNGASRHDSSGPDPHTAAADVLKAIAAYREAKRPQSIASVIEIRKRVMVVYSNVLGPPQGLGTDYQNVDGGLPEISWDPDADWIRRYLAPGLVMPGWSPIKIPAKMAKLANGEMVYESLPVRQPAQKPLRGVR